MKMVVHDSVLRLVDYFETSNALLMVLEHEQGGSLFEYMRERNFFIPEQRAKTIALKIA